MSQELLQTMHFLSILTAAADFLSLTHTFNILISQPPLSSKIGDRN